MLGIHHYGLFLLAGILLNLTPGQDTMFILGRSLTGGRRAGIAAALGIALTNALNPKVALFFLAFLPQFIQPASPTRTLAFLALGGTFITTGLAWCLVLASGAARLQGFFAQNPRLRAGIDRVVGALFAALGARLAWAR